MFNIEVRDGHKGTSMDSLYDVLGVSSRANETAIRTAFRKAAKSYHPDLNAGNPTAELQFRQIVAAYELLKDPLQREAYDQQLKGDRRARARRIASPLISGVVSGGLVAFTMWWFNTHKPAEPAQAPRVAVADIDEPAGQHAAVVTATANTAARQDDGNPVGAANGPTAPDDFPDDRPRQFAGATPSAPSDTSTLANEWQRLRATGDAMAIWEFAVRNPGAPEAELARGRLLTLLEASHNAFLLQMLSVSAPELIAERARQRIASLGISAENGASPDPSVPLEERAAKFITAQVAAWSPTHTNNLSTLVKAYADEVYYNGSLKARATVVREKRRLLERSPERVYGVQPGSIKAECSSNLCRVSGIVEWQTRGAARSSGASAAAASGAAQFEYGTIYSRGAFSILSENNSAVKTNVSQEASHQRPSAPELPRQDTAVQALPRLETSSQDSPDNP